MSVHCNIKIQWEHLVRGMLGATVLLPLVLVGTALCCSICCSLPGTEPDLAGGRWRGLSWGSAHTPCKGTDLLGEPQPLPGPTIVRSSRESKYATPSPDEMSGGQVYALSLLQLSANPAVACTAPVLSPTNASARKAGTGDTAIKVSEKQTLRVRIGGLAHLMLYRNDCFESLSSIINDTALHFF